jgi:hypothetical protein
MASLTKAQREEVERERSEAIDTLRQALPPGSTVYTMTTWANSIGNSRRVKVLIVSTHDNDRQPSIWRVSYLVARALRWKLNRDEQSVVVGGGGMNMEFELVYRLGDVLWPDHDRDGGYALRNESI